MPAAVTASLARARLGETARAVAAAHGGWRAAALARARTDRRAPTIADLLEAPEWLRWPAPERLGLARLAACAHLAPRIARTLDGAVLGALDRAVGAAALGWAITLGEGIDFAPALSAADAAGADMLGQTLLLSALSPVLAAELANDAAPVGIAPEAAARAVALAREAWPQRGHPGPTL